MDEEKEEISTEKEVDWLSALPFEHIEEKVKLNLERMSLDELKMRLRIELHDIQRMKIRMMIQEQNLIEQIDYIELKKR